MKIDYEKYIQRLQAKRANSPYAQAFKQQASANALTQRSIDQQLRSTMGMRGFSAGAIEQTAQSRDEAARASTGARWAEMAEKDAVRNDQIDSRIESLELQKEQQDEAIRQQVQEKKNALIKTGFQIGGAAVGAGVGVFAGNPMLGAQVGSAGGQMLGSFIGGDGKMSTRNFNPEEFMSGFQDTVSSVSSALTLNSQRNDLSTLTDLVKGRELSSKDILFLSEFLQAGDVMAAKKYLGATQ